MSQTSRSRVAVLIETSKTYGRGLLDGVSHYIRTHQSWSVFINERSLDDPLPSWLKKGACDGVLLRTADRKVLRRIQQLDVPIVYLGEFYDTDFPFVISSDEGIVAAALEELWERGFRRFGYVGVKGMPWADRRRNTLEEIIQDRKASLSILEPAAESGGLPNWPQHRQQMIDWLQELPRPVGIICCYDVAGVRLMDTCRDLGIAVPEEVAVIGVDNDPCLCDFSDPPLSSVAHDLSRIGYRAAEILDDMLNLREHETGTIEVDPHSVIVRQSSDIVAVEDPEIAAALRYIRQHACDGINVTDVLKHIPLTRVTLKRRFEKTIGRSAKEEIVRLQLNRVRQLLTETDFTLETIAPMAGFRHPEYLSTMFKQHTGLTPGQFRRQNHK